MEYFRKTLKEFRKAKHKTQKQFAKEINVNVATVLNWEKGYKEPTLSSIIALCKYFDITPNDLIGPVTQCIYRQEDKCTESEESPP